MRKVLLIVFLVTMMVIASMGTAMAESVFFPYISKGGGVDTVITVINKSVQPQLWVSYMTKAAVGNANNELINPCEHDCFFRPSTLFDIVTFAVGGNASLNGGNAMFGDPTNYNAGAGFPNWNTNHPGDRRGSLTIATANANLQIATGATNVGIVDGEFSSYDLTSGAMWGGYGLPSNIDGAAAGTPATINSFSYNRVVHACGGATTVPLLENLTWATTPPTPSVGVYPEDQFTNAVFVTPHITTTGAAMVAADCSFYTAGFAPMANMKTVDVQFTNPIGNQCMIDRNEAFQCGGAILTVRCVGRIDLIDLTGGAVVSPLAPGNLLNTVGGWGQLDLLDPTAILAGFAPAPAVPAGLPATDHESTVYNLKYGNITGMTGIVNDGKPVCDWATGCR